MGKVHLYSFFLKVSYHRQYVDVLQKKNEKRHDLHDVSASELFTGLKTALVFSVLKKHQP